MLLRRVNELCKGTKFENCVSERQGNVVSKKGRSRKERCRVVEQYQEVEEGQGERR